MFWKSVIGGLGMFLHWQTWLIVMGAFGLQMIFRVLLAIFIERAGERYPVFGIAGFITHALVEGIMWGSFLVLTLVFLFPLMVGFNVITPVSVVLKDIRFIFITGFQVFILLAAISFIPLIGNLIGTHNIALYIGSIIVYRNLLGSLTDGTPIEPFVEQAYPGFFTSVGFLVVTYALQYVALIPIALKKTIEDPYGLGNDGPGFGSLVVLSIFSYLPVFMYAEYVKIALRS